jgi:hypothetical protein
MKELFNTLSSVSNFFNERRFIFGAEQSNNEPKVDAVNRKIEFPELVVNGEKPRKTMEFPEMVIKSNAKKKGEKLLADGRLDKLMDRALAGGKKENLKKESGKSFAGLRSPDELVGKLGGGNRGEEAQVLGALGKRKDEKEENPKIASLDKDKNK